MFYRMIFCKAGRGDKIFVANVHWPPTIVKYFAFLAFKSRLIFHESTIGWIKLIYTSNSHSNTNI